MTRPSALGARDVPTQLSVLALIRGAVRSAAARVRRWLVAARPDGKRRILLVFDLNGPALGEAYGSVEFRELTAAEIAERRASLGPGVAAPAPADADSGCIVGVQAGRQVYHAWYIRGDGSRLHGAPGGWKPSGRVLFLHDGFTEPEFRGRGIHSAATRWMLARERGTDVAHAVCVVHADNAAAQHVVRKLGFRRVGPIK